MITTGDKLGRVSASDGLRVVLRKWLISHGLTQGDFAKRIHRSQSSVSMLLSGSRQGSALDFLESVGAEMGMSLSELVRQAEASDPSDHARTPESSPTSQEAPDRDPTPARIRELEARIEELTIYKLVVDAISGSPLPQAGEIPRDIEETPQDE